MALNFALSLVLAQWTCLPCRAGGRETDRSRGTAPVLDSTHRGAWQGLDNARSGSGRDYASEFKACRGFAKDAAPETAAARCQEARETALFIHGIGHPEMRCDGTTTVHT